MNARFHEHRWGLKRKATETIASERGLPILFRTRESARLYKKYVEKNTTVIRVRVEVAEVR